MNTFLISLLIGLAVHGFLIEGQELTDYLWDQTKDERQAALDSVFVKAISNVTLDPVEFGAYLVQDAIYLYSVKKSMDMAASRTNEETVKGFLQNYASRRYTSLYTNALKDWHVQDPNSIILGNECQDYVDHLFNVAETMDPVISWLLIYPVKNCGHGSENKSELARNILASIISGWKKIGQDPNINVHLEFEKVANDAFINGKITKEKALDVYRKSMRGEVEFFNSVSSPGKQTQEVHDEL